jgi:hypothetical protein
MDAEMDTPPSGIDVQKANKGQKGPINGPITKIKDTPKNIAK